MACCATGDCCSQASDCPVDFSMGATCTDPSTCQGSRVDAVCQQNQCASTSVDDDTGCSGLIVSECGLYPSISCLLSPNQSAPACATSCTSNAECDAHAICNGNACVPIQSNGAACSEPSECVSGHCQNGYCCTSGDCCAASADCPNAYRELSTCGDTASCQGTRVDAACQLNRCTSVSVADDSGCEGEIAHNCGFYTAVICSAQQNQIAPECATSCTSNEQCDPSFTCHENSCQPAMSNGSPCSQSTQCASGHCQNGYCCESGDCCINAFDCPASYRSAPVCMTPSECQGSRIDASCEVNRCVSVSRADDSACTAESFTLNCFTYIDVSCNGQREQGAPECLTSCTSDDHCKVLEMHQSELHDSSRRSLS